MFVKGSIQDCWSHGSSRAALAVGSAGAVGLVGIAGAAGVSGGRCPLCPSDAGAVPGQQSALTVSKCK